MCKVWCNCCEASFLDELVLLLAGIMVSESDFWWLLLGGLVTEAVKEDTV